MLLFFLYNIKIFLKYVSIYKSITGQLFMIIMIIIMIILW